MTRLEFFFLFSDHLYQIVKKVDSRSPRSSYSKKFNSSDLKWVLLDQVKK